MGFVIAPMSLVKGENQYPEFRDIFPSLEQTAVSRAKTIWKGFEFGGVLPGADQFGMMTFRPKDVHGGGTATFNKTYGSAGSWARIWSYNVPEDEIHAFAGVLIPDPTLIFAQLRFEFEDRILPIMNIEEAHGFTGGGFAILFKQDKGKEFVIQEERRVLLRGFQERGTRNRTQRVIPLGFTLFKNKDLAIREVEVSD